MERMESRLYEAALEGSVTTLIELLQQDRLLLDKATMNCLSETPLHVAALLGHVDFVKEILRRKPELAKELDLRQNSVLHIASQKGYVEIVKALLQANPDMCFARDMDGRNPLHLAAMKGRIHVLEELVKTRPIAASVTMIWGETILHLCVKYNQLEALKFLLATIEDAQFLNAKDDYNMTILHLAVANKQIEVIGFLTTNTTINVNALNANGYTAFDMLAQSKRDIKDWEIGELLRQAGAIRAMDMQLSAKEQGITSTNSLSSTGNNQKKQGKGAENISEKEDNWLEKKRNVLMVVASLIATMAFQAGVNPPRSPWNDYSSEEKASTTSSFEPPTATISVREYPYKYITYDGFLVYNTTGFMASLSIILLLISGLPLKHKLFMWILMVIIWVAITAMAMTYMVAIDFLAKPNHVSSEGSFIVIYVGMGVAGIFFLGHSTRLAVKMIKYVKKSIRRPRCNKQVRHGHEPLASLA